MTTERDVGPQITPRLVLGLSIMALGLLLTLDNLGVLEARHFLRFWPVILIGVGLAKLVECGLTRVGAWIWIFLGTALLLHELHMVAFERLWPAFLIFLGGAIAWKALGRPRLRRRAVGDEAPASPDRVSAFAVMGSVVRGSNSQDFRGGDLTAVMGGCEVDLSRASIAGGEATIDTFAVWGGIEITVPEDWEVVNRGLALMGGFADKTKHPLGGAKRLVLTGLAIMGGVEVKN